MSGKTFDRVLLNQRERPLSSDINQAETQLDRTLRDYLDRASTGRTNNTNDASTTPVSGFIGDSLKVRPNSPIGTAILVAPGMGFQVNASDVPTAIGSITSVDDLARYKPLVLNTQQTITVPPNSSGNPRIDIIEVKYNRHTTDTSSRDVFNTGTGTFDPTSVQKTLAWAIEDSVTTNGAGALNLKSGTPAAVPLVPSTDTGYVKLAEILVGNGFVTLDADVIKDTRQQLFQYNVGDFAFQIQQSTVTLPTILSHVHSPPGFLVVGVGTSTAFARSTVYIMGGDLTSSFQPNATATIRPLVISPPPITALTSVITAAADIFTLTATETAAILGVNSSAPGTKVAVGQVAIRVQLAATPTPGTEVVYSVQVKARGG